MKSSLTLAVSSSSQISPSGSWKYSSSLAASTSLMSKILPQCSYLSEITSPISESLGKSRSRSSSLLCCKEGSFCHKPENSSKYLLMVHISTVWYKFFAMKTESFRQHGTVHYRTTGKRQTKYHPTRECFLVAITRYGTNHVTNYRLKKYTKPLEIVMEQPHESTTNIIEALKLIPKNQEPLLQRTSKLLEAQKSNHRSPGTASKIPIEVKVKSKQFIKGLYTGIIQY